MLELQTLVPHPCYDSPLFFSFGLLLSFLAITHPSHVISPLTTLVFIIASFYSILQTSLTQPCLLLCASLQFHCLPFVSLLFWNFLSLWYINPQLTTYFPKLDHLCTLVHCCTNLVPLFFSCPLTLCEPLSVL